MVAVEFLRFHKSMPIQSITQNHGGFFGGLKPSASNLIGKFNNAGPGPNEGNPGIDPAMQFGGPNAGEGMTKGSLVNLSDDIKNLTLTRQKTTSSETIALYMPDTMVYSYAQNYDQLSLGNEFAGQALAAAKSAVEEYNKTGKLSSATGSVVKSGGNVLLQTLAQANRHLYKTC